MFCDGKCKIEKQTEDGTIIKRCGLLRDLVMENKMTNETKTVEVCMIESMMMSLLRQEQGQIRIQAATESARNESVEQARNINQTIANGFLGLIKEVENRSLFLKDGNEIKSQKILNERWFAGSPDLGQE